MTRFDRHSDHPPASRLDDVAPDDGVFGPIGAFDEHVRLHRGNQIKRCVLVEDDDPINARERLEHLGPLGLAGDRTIGSLVLTDGSVGVHTNQQRIAKLTRVLQIAQVTDVQQVEDAVGEDDLPAGGAQPRDKRDGFPYDYHRLLYTFRVKSRTHDVGIYRPRHRWSFSPNVIFKSER